MNLYLKSVDLSFLERYGEAIECINKAIELNPKESQFWFTKAIFLIELNNLDDAIGCLDKAIELNPEDTNSLIKKGSLLQYLNRADEAIECYDEALSLNPSDANLLQSMGDLYLIELGNYDEALKYYNEAIKLGSENSMLWNNLGDIYLNTGEFEKGLECCDKALSLDSNNFGLVETPILHLKLHFGAKNFPGFIKSNITLLKSVFFCLNLKLYFCIKK